MARTVFYEILDQPDGTISARVTLEPDQVHTCDRFKSLAEVMEWVEGLRVLMAACGAPVVVVSTPEEIAEEAACKLPRALPTP